MKKIPKVLVVDVFITKNGGILAPEDLPALVGAVEKALASAGFDPRGGSELIIVSGRLPIWAAAAVIHTVGHARPAAGSFDPRLGGGVVAMSHTPDFRIGDLVPLNGDEVKVEVHF